MILSYTFHRMELHLDCLPGSEFRQNDVWICTSRCWCICGEDVFLFTGRFPFQMRRKQFVVDVQFRWIRAAFGRVGIAFTDNLDGKDDGIAVSRLFRYA